MSTQPKTKLSKMKNNLMLNILLSESVITPQSCSVLVTELVKYIIYQKEVIPYPFETLNYYVSKRRDLDNYKDTLDSNSILGCAASERYFKQTMDATATISSFLESISFEIMTPQKQLSDVVLLLGPTPGNPKQVFHIVLPELTLGHLDTQHSSKRPLQSVMKEILIDDSFNKALREKLPKSTNLYVLLKIKGPKPYANNNYIQRENFRLPDRCQHVAFRFHTPSDIQSCACVIPYEDSFLSLGDISISANDSNDKINKELDIGRCGIYQREVSDEFEDPQDSNLWYQNKLTLKSLKEVKVKGSAVVNFWVHPSTFD